MHKETFCPRMIMFKILRSHCQPETIIVTQQHHGVTVARPPLGLAVAGSIPGRNFFNFRFSTTISVACSIVSLNCCRSSNVNYFLHFQQPAQSSSTSQQATYVSLRTDCLLAVTFGTVDKRVCQEFTIDILQQTSKTLASYSHAN